MTKSNERFPVSSDTINTHSAHQLCADSWWTAYASPGTPQQWFYDAARVQDIERFSRQPREIPMFTDQRFGPIKPSRQSVEGE